jgi:Arc/MetJ-type ribon-helix-helix transcriptional regulator
MLTKDNTYKPVIFLRSMASALIGVRLPPPLSSQVEEISKAEGYTSTQEFVRETLRDRVKEYYRQRALDELDKLAGSLKGKKINKLSARERERLAKKL